MVRPIAICALVSSAFGQAAPAPPDPHYPGARQLCAEHVSGQDMHISWESYATADPVDRVVAHFQRASGRTATVRADGSRHFDWDAVNKMSIYPAARNDAFPNCDVKTSARERTVILSSVGTRR